MNRSYPWFMLPLVCLYFELTFSSVSAQDSTGLMFDLEKEGKIIDSLDKQFAYHFLNGDSAAIYSMYCRDAKFEDLKGNEILASWGKQIRNSIAMDTRHLVFTTTCLSTDMEFLAELGVYEFKDSKGLTKDKGKYLAVWKQESGAWKLFRVLGL